MAYIGLSDAVAPVKFAYADPPYLGQSKKHYGDHPKAWVYDHPQAHFDLITRLVMDFPDGWALSASSPSLRVLLPHCPEDVRVAAWVKPMHVFKKGVRPAYSWEPILFRGGRNQNPPVPPKGGAAITPKDHLVVADEALVENITLRKGLVGAKPPAVCRWVLDLLGYEDGDELVDLFPGTGIMDVVTGRTPLQDGLFEVDA